MTMNKTATEEITQEMITQVQELIGSKIEVNMEWLRVVTQIDSNILSRIVIQHLGYVVLEGIIYTKEVAERKLDQRQADAEAEAQREAFRKGPVQIDMMKLRENSWTVNFQTKILAQKRHIYSAIWSFLEENQSSITLQRNWFSRLEKAVKQNLFPKAERVDSQQILNVYGEDQKGKSKAIFAKTKPFDSQFGENSELWVMFLVSITETGVLLEGLNMMNILKISTKFRSRERAYAVLNEYLELINFLVSDPSKFSEVIIVD